MKQIKKRTLALVLASVITVVGAFGEENYQNSLMGLKFENRGKSSVNVVLLTKKNYENNINVVKKDAFTYTIMLPDTDNKTPGTPELGANIQSVNINTMPYTNSNRGYTKITIKTGANVPLYASSALYVEDKSAAKNQLETTKKTPEPVQETLTPPEEIPKSSVNSKAAETAQKSIPAKNTVSSNNSANISKKAVQKRVSSPKEMPIKKTVYKKNENSQIQENSSHANELFHWFLFAILIISSIGFLFFRGKEKMAEVIGELGEYDISDESKKDVKKRNNKKTVKTANAAIKNLNKKDLKPVKMPVKTPQPPVIQEENPAATEQEEDSSTIVDLDELLREKNKTSEPSGNINAQQEEEENAALEEFLKAFDFSDDGDVEKKSSDITEDEKELFNEELYNKCVNNENLRFSSDDIESIETLMNSEISDDTLRHTSEFMDSSEKNKKPSPLEKLENFVTVYTVKQNISFSRDDVRALYKLINVEIGDDFISDLRTDPERMKQMQEEIDKQRSKPHKTSEMLTLNVKDMLPDLSEALKRQGGRRIESEAKPQVVYFSEGYDVSKLKPDSVLPDLSKEINNEDAYRARPSDEIQYADNSYEVQKMTIKDELPDLEDVLKNPEKYNTKEVEPREVDEEALLKNISNVTFKPFYDGTEEFEIINEFDDPETPTISDMQKEFSRFNDNFEIISEDAYRARPSDEIQYVDNSYEVQKMTIKDELPDLEDVLKNPEKYNTEEVEPREVDEEALLKNISNVTFKPFYDGTEEFEIINEFDDPETPTISGMQEEFSRFNDNFEIISNDEDLPPDVPSDTNNNDNDDFEALYENNSVDLDMQNLSETVADELLNELDSDTAENIPPKPRVGVKNPEDEKLESMIQDIKNQRNLKKAEKKENKKAGGIASSVNSNKPEFCVLDGERYSIISVSHFTDKMGCYLAKNESGNYILGFVGDKIFKIKQYEKLDTEKMQSRLSEKLDDGTLRYIIRIGIHKFILNVTQEDMEFVMDLC